jgi:hypothetical protein
MVARIFEDMHNKITKTLAVSPLSFPLLFLICVQAVKSRISFSSDTWTTPQMMYTFVGTLASFIDKDWEMVELLVGFKPLTKDEHKGERAAHAFIKTTADVSALRKISDFMFSILKLIVSSHSCFSYG